ncbi:MULTISPECIES: DUF2786 domain-containing protein [Actinomyces]|uniref:DUF2786 domain-containing protein n=1 Tax=Actinomyces TaxID=1654 RepID=UPI001357FBFB|nr:MULTISPECIES: DUF2786 domain-containing protein [Actinomyces]
MSVDDKARRTIRRLLAIAGDEAASPAERELAMERATVLMARHSITGLTDDPDARSREVATRSLTVAGGTSTASLALAYGIGHVARAGGAGAYFTDRRRWRTADGGPGVDVHLVAVADDLDWLEPLTHSLLTHAALGWATWRRDNPRRWKPMKTTTRQRVRNGYMAAYAAGVADRVRATRQDAIDRLDEAERTSTALTVRTRAQRVQDHLATLDLTHGKDVDADLRAAAQGRADGWASGLGQPAYPTIERN